MTFRRICLIFCDRHIMLRIHCSIQWASSLTFSESWDIRPHCFPGNPMGIGTLLEIFQLVSGREMGMKWEDHLVSGTGTGLGSGTGKGIGNGSGKGSNKGSAMCGLRHRFEYQIRHGIGYVHRLRKVQICAWTQARAWASNQARETWVWTWVQAPGQHKAHPCRPCGLRFCQVCVIGTVSGTCLGQIQCCYRRTECMCARSVKIQPGQTPAWWNIQSPR